MRGRCGFARCAIAACTVVLLALPAAAQDKSNILVIWGDDIGITNLSAG